MSNISLPASNVGKDWGVERKSYLDPVTGVEIWEMTRGPAAADNLYFHFSNFTADNRFLIFTSDRSGVQQLYRANVQNGRIVQLTDEAEVNARSACPDQTVASRLYYLRGPEIIALQIHDFTTRVVGEIPEPHMGGFQQPTQSSDGKWLALGKRRDSTTWEIGLMKIETGEYRTVITQGFQMGHVQHSPTDSIIFFVWETGGFAPQRSWLVNTDGTGNRPFYFRTKPDEWFTSAKEWVTHEAWINDTGEMTMINDKVGVMLVNKDGSSRIVREGHYWHCAARPDGKFIVADDFDGRLWLMESATGNIRLLATGLRDKTRIHSHSSFDRLGHYVQFRSGRQHETVALIDLRQLPEQDWLQLPENPSNR
ncbi:MAG TPA: hypothetical protein EYG38_20830 [Verrucomicrobia bacterium]|nr:hypothetical protein [Verrucomicrobiota bacterium]